MLAAQQPISSIIAIAHHHSDIVGNPSIEAKIDDFIDIIKSKIRHKSLPELSESLRERIFELRLDVLFWMSLSNEAWLALLEKMTQKIEGRSKNQINKTILEVLDTYQTIVSPFFKSTDFQIFLSNINPIAADKPEYHFFNVFESHPNNQVKFIKKWLDASLDFEMAMVIAELFITGEIDDQSDEKILAEINAYIRKTIIQFGAYSIFTGFSTADQFTDSPLDTNIKILAATLEMDFGIKRKRLSQDEFHQLIQN